MIPRRQKRLTGHRAAVDGIEFDMPVNSKNSPALMAAFSIDTHAARSLLPGSEIHPLRLLRGRSVLLVTVIDYRETDIGKYIEYSIAIPCTNGRKPAPPLLPGAFRRLFKTGQFVVDLPVSTEVSVKGGKGIWGMPKHQANLDFVITDKRVSSQYDLDGELCMNIDIERPSMLPTIPLNTSAVNYCAFRGMLMKSTIYFTGGTDVAFGRRAKAELTLGSHPRMDVLRDLDISSRPMFTAFIPNSKGVLDDHVEAWMLTGAELPTGRWDGLDSVADLGKSEDWLSAPNRPTEPGSSA